MRVVFYLFLFFCFFPYFAFLPLKTDSQPYALLLAILLFFIFTFKDFTIKKDFIYLFTSFFFSIPLIFFNEINFNSFASIANYLSLFFISFSTYKVLEKMNGLPFVFYRNSVFIWFFVGVVQLLLYPSFGLVFVPRGDNTALLGTGRGILSLAPEPTYYGIISAFLIFIGLLNFSVKKIKLPLLMLILQIFILSRSSTVIMLILISAFVFFIAISVCKKKITRVFMVGFMVFFVIKILDLTVVYYSDYRIGVLLKKALDNPTLFFLADESVNARFIHLFFPLKGFIDNFGLPEGFNSFSIFMEKMYMSGEYNHFFIFQTHFSNQIMSGFGKLLFELGVLSFGVIYVFYKKMVYLFKHSNNAMLSIFGILYIFVLFNAISFNTSTACFILGNIIYFVKQKGSINENFTN